ncbi:MAG: hypothetical protein IH840_13535 [Candidatus Heimdallarchaeota archaeon]|nr:hypothetical protein [Candidatus Heimdallarchaeota archaeon]
MDFFTKASKTYFIGCIAVYGFFIIDILLFKIQVWSVADLTSNEMKIKRSIFVVQTFRWEESISSTVILFGPSEIGYFLLFATPLVSAIIVSRSNREKSANIQSNYSYRVGFTVFFIMIDPIIILLLESKLNYYDNNFADFTWIDMVDLYLSIALLIILSIIFGSINLIGKIKLSPNPIMGIKVVLLTIIVIYSIFIFIYVLGSIANARIT